METVSNTLSDATEHYEHSVFATTVAAHAVKDDKSKLLVVPASMGKSFIILMTA